MLETYDATRSSPHRRSPPKIVKPHDEELNRRKRNIGVATVKEQQTNSALLAWMIRKHLDYVSRFEINFRSGNDALDREMQGLLEWHGRKANFDIARRHNRAQWMRIFECNKIINGDALGIMVEGGHMQGLESDQVARPDFWDNENQPDRATIERITDHGLILGKYGEVEQYCICRRNKHGRLAFDHFEPAENVVYDGYFTNFTQTRAPSPLLAAMNDVIDLSDIQLYTKVNLKLKNLFGIAVFRDDTASLGQQDTENDPITITPEAINILDLNAGDRVDKFDVNSPGANSMEFMDKLARVCMLSLDIPFTSLDSSKASFSARIGDRAEYEESAQNKRHKNADALREIYTWRVADWYNGNTELRRAAEAASMNAGQIVRALDIIPTGTPWMDRLNEAKGEMMSVALGTESIPRLARRRGLDAYKIVDEQAEFLAYCKAKDVPIFYAAGGQEAVQNIMDEPREPEVPNG
jgi:capsid protein